ncbi:hypothetical protein QBC32DRAFT_319530 [Pseudoneurospora amorphoporcata]|uniref:Uncharacterized protein n=1 Tax=Pseudoneurospora amorphoporcata TaxID=241081 RepID=A0AAN6NNG0_9PEZI|nr:hypothetical protein QBC32DRAFT_319530 [Pseudoneurospora amorphoporcata]
MKFLLTTALLASLGSLSLALPSPAHQDNFTPAFTSSLDDLFALLDSIPDSVLEEGDEALNQWFIDNDLRDPAAELLIDSSPEADPALDLGDLDVISDENLERGVLVARASAWKIAKCVASIVQLIATTAVPAAKLLKIKKYIKALGGVKMSVKLLLGATTKAEKLKAGGKALVYLSAELLGISSVKAACF